MRATRFATPWLPWRRPFPELLEALRIAEEDGKDPRHVQVVLDETVRIVRRGHGVVICETKHGFVCANAGVDLSNSTAEDVAVLLPLDPDASASRLREDLLARGSRNLAVIVTDTFGRPWRDGLVDRPGLREPREEAPAHGVEEHVESLAAV